MNTSREFRHRRSRVVVKLGAPRHTATDAIAIRGSSAAVVGKFAYSDASKDLEDELVIVEVWSNKAWLELGKVLTNDDGRAAYAIDAKYLEKAGPVLYRMTVDGDGTSTTATVWVLEKKAAIAVFDIDGTLTPGDREIIKRTIWGSAVKVRRGAADVVAHWTDASVQPIYLTGRPYLYNNDTRRWLRENKFPAGPLITPQSMRAAIPTASGVGAFKQKVLRGLLDGAGLVARVAYGNAKTDVCAFARAGIQPGRTYIFDAALTACPGHAKPKSIADFRAHLKTLRRP